MTAIIIRMVIIGSKRANTTSELKKFDVILTTCK